MKNKLFIGSLLFASSFSCGHAGWYANTAHSRGNCFGFNESITWNWSEYHWWRVKSLHSYGSDASHMLDTYMGYTWRAAAFDMMVDKMPHYTEWFIQGYHFYMQADGKVIYDVYTQSNNCSAYDGWWETNKAKGE